jgi:hypothetical protein
MSKEQERMMEHIAKEEDEEFETERRPPGIYYRPFPDPLGRLNKAVLYLCGRIQELEERLDAHTGKAD